MAQHCLEIQLLQSGRWRLLLQTFQRHQLIQYRPLNQVRQFVLTAQLHLAAQDFLYFRLFQLDPMNLSAQVIQ